MGNGDFIPGVTGAIRRSKNAGQSWDIAPLPVAPNSGIYWFGTHTERPNVIAAASLYGYIYVSEDGGDSWTKLWREFSEISSVLWLPG